MPPVKLLAEQSGLTLLGVSDAGSAPDVFLYYSPVVVDHTKVGSGACCTAEDVNHFIVQLDYTDDRFKTLANGGPISSILVGGPPVTEMSRGPSATRPVGIMYASRDHRNVRLTMALSTGGRPVGGGTVSLMCYSLLVASRASREWAGTLLRSAPTSE